MQGVSLLWFLTARDMWITANTLITALHLGIITYLFSGFIILFGLMFIGIGFVIRVLSGNTSGSTGVRKGSAWDG